uniref:Uncharacterized protein n=1 Tax=Setaria italica TaxID=4555 RepID=K3YKF5_SETIT
MVCDGPKGPSVLTTLVNFINIMVDEVGEVPHPYVEKKQIQSKLYATVVLKSTLDEKKEIQAGSYDTMVLNFIIDGGETKGFFKLIYDLGPQSYVTPI